MKVVKNILMVLFTGLLLIQFVETVRLLRNIISGLYVGSIHDKDNDNGIIIGVGYIYCIEVLFQRKGADINFVIKCDSCGYIDRFNYYF